MWVQIHFNWTAIISEFTEFTHLSGLSASGGTVRAFHCNLITLDLVKIINHIAIQVAAKKITAYINK